MLNRSAEISLSSRGDPSQDFSLGASIINFDLFLEKKEIEKMSARGYPNLSLIFSFSFTGGGLVCLVRVH